MAMFTAIAVSAVMSLGEIVCYNDLIHDTIQACNNIDILLTDAYTNSIVNYRNSCTNVQEACAADLSLALSLSCRMDHDSACIGNLECFDMYQSLVSNVVYNEALDGGIWLKYAAALEYIISLNESGQRDAGFDLSTNMLARLSNCAVDMGPTNYWNSMSRLLVGSDMSLETVFKINAAIFVAEHNRWQEFASFTNSLSTTEVEKLIEYLNLD